MFSNHEPPSLFIISSCSYAGNRSNNEDNCFCDGVYFKSGRFKGAKGLSSCEISTISAGAHLFAVCDGMGGEALGDAASAIAVDYADSLYEKLLSNPTVAYYQSMIGHFYTGLNKAVVQYAAQNRVSRMGTTMAAAYINNETLYCSNVGDSKVFLYRDRQIEMLTYDDNVAYALYRKGEITERELASHPGKTKLLQYLGMNDTVTSLAPHLSDGIRLQKGDVILLCSDGVTDGISGQQLGDVIAKACKGDASMAQAIVDKAYEGGSDDNITAVAVQFV